MSSFEFDFFAQPNKPPESDLEQVMNQIQQHSLDFGDFQQVKNNANDQSLNSDFFLNENPQPQQQKPIQKPPSEQKKYSNKSKQQSNSDHSRYINQISFMNQSSTSFRFQQPPKTYQQQQTSDRYAKLQAMMSKAKKNSLDAFYRNIDNPPQQNYKVQDKFRDKQQFKYYSRQLKLHKRDLQKRFQDNNGKYNFNRDNNYKVQQRKNVDKNQQFNFSKKAPQNDPFLQSNNSKNNPFRDSAGDPFNTKKSYDPFENDKQEPNPFGNSKNSGFNHFGSQLKHSGKLGKGGFDYMPERDKPELDYDANLFLKINSKTENAFLPQSYQPDDGFDFVELGQQEIKKQVQRFEQKQYEQQAQDFFKQSSQKPIKKQKKPQVLSPIRQEHPQMQKLTNQQQKVTQLVSHYEDLKGHFSNLMGYLKNNNNDQQKIISQLRHLKNKYESKQQSKKRQQQMKKQQQQAKEMANRQKQRKLSQIRDQIKKMKEAGEKDILYTKVNQRIQNLQELVKNAITQINQEKQQKFIPKIINYYVQQEPVNINPHYHEDQPQNSFSRHQNPSKNYKRSQIGLSRSSHLNQSQNNELNQEYFLGNIRKAVKELQEDRSIQQFNVNEFTSPLDLDLTTNQMPANISRSRSRQLQEPFRPPEKGIQYLANSLDTTNKHLRRCLTQKSSVLFQSFEFYVTGRFTISNNSSFPVVCQVRVANKCAINLYDVFLVVYGPQAQQTQLQIRPPRLIYDEFKQNTSNCFQVDLSKNCLDNGFFHIQISYKSDGSKKKKVNFKALLPFCQLIKPQFIYQQQFINTWNHMQNELYIRPKTLDFKSIRNHQDLKLIMPFIQINQNDPNSFAYAIMFTYPKSNSSFLLKVICYVNGKASLHLKSSHGEQDRKLREEILDVMNFLCFG